MILRLLVQVHFHVLIVPLWNWNSEIVYIIVCSTTSFNRTFMELKYYFYVSKLQKCNVLIVPLWNWNKVSSISIILILSFNRTFMELKYYFYVSKLQKCNVLIVPLWNWNKVSSISIILILSFNRTFMELKSYRQSPSPLDWEF